jgi:hypothetical protein
MQLDIEKQLPPEVRYRDNLYKYILFLFQKACYDTTAKSSLYLKIFWLKIEDASELTGHKCPCRGCAGAATSHG